MANVNFKVKKEKYENNYAKFIIEPLDQGYGHTLGNSLRRVLLTSLPGAAITSIRIDGVKHQFSTLPGLKEDIVELILNIKKLKVVLHEGETQTIRLSVKGPKTITAADIETTSAVEIVNKDQYVATVADKGKLEIEFTVDSGFGYSLAEERKTNTVGVIPLDANFSPVVRVNYVVEATRVGRMTNLDKLILEIWTAGTIDAEVALKTAAQTVASYFSQIYEPKKVQEDTSVTTTPLVSDEILKMTVEELDLPTRITNSLRNGGIETISQLINADRRELLKIKNLGAKSLSIVEVKLKEKGVSLNV